jgi:hypothetical protein
MFSATTAENHQMDEQLLAGMPTFRWVVEQQRLDCFKRRVALSVAAS